MKRAILLAALCATACSQDNYKVFNQFAQGTTYTIVVKNPTAGLEEKIEHIFAEIDTTFSVFNPASLTSRINRNETDITTPLFEECFAMAKEVYAATEGYFDSTVAPLVDAWGFGAGAQAAEPDMDSILEFVGMDKVRIEDGRIIKAGPRVQLNFSSIAKGFTVDRLAEMIEREGVTDYMVEVGGEVRAHGENASGREWRIGIDKPTGGLGGGEYEAIVSLSDSLAAIATSGNYRNTFTDEAGRTRVHTIDPKTGTAAPSKILSVSIVAAECAVADAWATGVLASGTIENVRRLLAAAPRGVEYYVIHAAADSTASFHSGSFPFAK